MALQRMRRTERKHPSPFGQLLCSMSVIVMLLAAPVNVGADEAVSAITMPIEDITLSFVQSGRVAKIHVKEGDLVQPGQLLVQLDDTAEQTQLLMLKEQSEDMTEVEGRRALLEHLRHASRPFSPCSGP